MKKFTWFTLTLFFLMIFTASMVHAGYKSEPWGSKTWTGPGRPPHWSSEPVPQRKIEKHNRRHNHHSRRFDSTDYRQPRNDEVIIDREKRIPVYIPIQRKPAKLQCSGATITRKDPKTGEMIIEYVTRARDC